MSQFVKNVIFNGTAKYSGVALNLIVTAILARLLTPAEFGEVAVLLVFATFFNLLTEFGIGPAVIYNKLLEYTELRSLFTFSLLIGLLFGLIFYALSPLIASFYNMDLLFVNALRTLSFSILFYSGQVVPLALLKRNLNFKKVGIISVIVQFTSSTIAVLLAYNNWGYMSLIWKYLLESSLLFLIYSYTSKIFPGRIVISSLRKIFSYSSFQFGFNFINYFSRNLDTILISKFLGSIPLGYYDRAYRLTLIPVTNLTQVISPVMMSHLSLQNSIQDVYSKYVKVVTVLGYLGVVISTICYFFADEIVTLIYGDQWGESSRIFRVMSFSLLVQIVLSSGGAIFQAVGKTKFLFVNGLFSSLLMISAIVFGLLLGGDVLYIAWSLNIAFVLNFFIGFYILIQVAMGMNYFNFLKSFTNSIKLLVLIVLPMIIMQFFRLDDLIVGAKYIVYLGSLFIGFGFIKNFRILVLSIFNRIV